MTPAARDDDSAPQAPSRPSPDECCQGGCARCVFDLYEDMLDRYRVELAAWHARRGTRPTG
jgi:hypothetical protein